MSRLRFTLPRVKSVPDTRPSGCVSCGSKIRYKTVRGYKSIEGMVTGLGLTQWVWSGEEGLGIGELLVA